MRLSGVKNADGIRKKTQIQFYGLDHNIGAQDGSLWDMKNLTGEHYPVLSTRGRRKKYTTAQTKLTKPNGIFSAGEYLIYADGTTLTVKGDGGFTGTYAVTDTKKIFAALGERVVVWPDKKVWTRTDGLQSIEVSTQASCVFCDGTYAGEEAEANTIKAPAGFDWATYFKVGDAVTISGAADAENNKTSVVREIEGRELRFYENCFTVNSTAATLTVSREAPDLDFICSNENRVWGCKGDEIRACKLGDPFNWNVFDGISTDSYSVQSGTAGEFTGCVSFLGYPCFFKEESIFKIYGSRPSNFELMSSANMGVLSGSGGSMAIAGEQLVYLSPSGFTVYSGGLPGNLQRSFGQMRFSSAVSGSDGLRYYASAVSAGSARLYVYDARSGLWHVEDGYAAAGFAKHGSSLYMLGTDGDIWIEGDTSAAPAGCSEEAAFDWYAEFGDFTEYSSKSPDSGANKKTVSRLLIRLELDTGATCSAYLRFDSTGDWIQAGAAITADVKRSYNLPIIPRRCDHYRLKLTGTGGCRIYSIARESSGGSELRSRSGRQ